MHIDPNIEPQSLGKYALIKLLINSDHESLGIVRCLDTATGKPCDVLFVPADDGEGGIVNIPAFPLPPDDMHDLKARYVPMDFLPESNQTNYHNN